MAALQPARVATFCVRRSESSRVVPVRRRRAARARNVSHRAPAAHRGRAMDGGLRRLLGRHRAHRRRHSAPPPPPDPTPPPTPAPLVTTVTASYFGPGLFGNRTACGLTLTTSLQGVAHRTLPCGSPVTLRYGANTLTVPVVDRGPQVAGREFDLTYATKLALGCPDICTLQWMR